MKLNKERFLKTEFGSEMKQAVKAIDYYLCEQSKISEWQDPEKYRRLGKDIDCRFAQWRIFKLAVKQFYGIEYNLTRTDDYFGVCTEDETDWLFKTMR